MAWFGKVVNSSIGGKLVVALSGLGLCLFLLAHLSGNLLVFGSRDAIDIYAEGLRRYPGLLWGMRIGLIVMAVIHIVWTIKLNRANALARPEKYALKKYRRATLQSRTMALSGLLLLAYGFFHLAHFTWRVTSPEIGSLGPFEARRMLFAAFSQPTVVATYIVAMGLLGAHLSHGISSLFQTLGINHNRYQPILSRLGPVLGGVVAIGYASIPLAIFFGLISL